jgi:acyl-CoA reductase-like NAD-dependent aldehyde dehydrogenase
MRRFNPKIFSGVAGGAKETGSALLDIDFNGYFFTGSYKTGKFIYERSSLKNGSLSGIRWKRDPLYIAEDVADVENAAIENADGAFYNNGQSCWLSTFM